MQEIVEPGLTSEEQEDLKTRKKEWEQFNAGVAEAKRVHVERVARLTSAELFVEMRRLRRVLN
jgi:predicted secreted Zn-dependent protease